MISTGTVEYENIELSVPKTMTFVFSHDDSGDDFARNALFLYPYILKAEISNGRAAEILGVGKQELIEFYEDQGLMCLMTTEQDLLSDLDTLRSLSRE